MRHKKTAFFGLSRFIGPLAAGFFGILFGMMLPDSSPAQTTNWATVVNGSSFANTSAFTAAWAYNYPWGNDHNGSALMNPTNINVSAGVVTLTSSPVTSNEGASGESPYLTFDYNSATYYLKQELTISSNYPILDVSGYFEVPTVVGTWPAFWLTGANTWPPESDIMEFKGTDRVDQETYDGTWQTVYVTIPTSGGYTGWHQYRVVATMVNTTNVSFQYYTDGVLEATQVATTFVNSPEWLIVDYQMEGGSGTPGPDYTTYYYCSNIVVLQGNVTTATTNNGVPPAPTGLTATAGLNEVSLYWTASAGATGYNVYRSTITGLGYILLATGTNVAQGTVGSPFVDSTATGGTYYYIVAGVNTNGVGPQSTQVGPVTPCVTPAVTTPTISPAAVAQAGASVKLTESATDGGGALTYQWNLGGSPINGAISNVYTFTANTGTTGSYSCTVASACDQATNSPAVVVTLAPPVQFSGIAQELFDGMGTNGAALSGLGNGSTTIGFASGSTWHANGSSSLQILLNDASDATSSGSASQANPDTLPGLAASNGSVASLVLSAAGNNWSPTSWCARQLANPIAFTNNGTYYFTVRLDNGGNSSCGIGFTTGTSKSSRFVGAGLSWNTWTGANGNAAFVEDGTLTSGTIYSSPTNSFNETAAGFIDGPCVMLGKLTTTTSANTTLSIKIYKPGTTLPNSAPGNWDVTQTWTESLTANDLLLWLNGGGMRCAVDAFRLSTNFSDVVPTTLPAAPTGLTSTAGNNQVSLSWMAPSDIITSYNVYRSSTGGTNGLAQITTPGSQTTTNYADTTVVNGNTYYYAVTAVGAGSESGFSTEVSTTPTAAPMVLNIQQSGSNVILTWSNGTLLRATNVTGPYNPVSGATSPLTNTSTTTSQFFRVLVQ